LFIFLNVLRVQDLRLCVFVRLYNLVGMHDLCGYIYQQFPNSAFHFILLSNFRYEAKTLLLCDVARCADVSQYFSLKFHTEKS